MSGYIVAAIVGMSLGLSAVLLYTKFVLKKDKAIDAGFARQQGKQIEELSRFAGGLAHELKNPLSIIKVNLKLITEDTAAGDIDRALRKIGVVSKEAERLEQILENFLNFIGKCELQTEKTDINEIVGYVVDFYSPQAYKNTITVRFAAYEQPLICNVDAGQLKQVILNLLLNAQQAIEKQGEIIIRIDKENNFAVIEISDTGKGISPEKIDKVFEAFYTTKSGGSGLGLAIAKKIISAHNGFIAVCSQPQKGTSFKISMPLCQ